MACVNLLIRLPLSPRTTRAMPLLSSPPQGRYPSPLPTYEIQGRGGAGPVAGDEPPWPRAQPPGPAGARPAVEWPPGARSTWWTRRRGGSGARGGTVDSAARWTRGTRRTRLGFPGRRPAGEGPSSRSPRHGAAVTEHESRILAESQCVGHFFILLLWRGWPLPALKYFVCAGCRRR